MRTPYDLMLNVQAVKSSSELTTMMGQYFNQLGFDKYAYFVVDYPQETRLQKSYISNYPMEWQQRYTSKDFFNLDPVYGLAHTRKKSFVWGSDEAIVPLSVEQKKFFQEAGDVGTSQGLSLPVFLPYGGFCLLSLCSDHMNKREMEIYLKHIDPQLISSAMVLHQSMLMVRNHEMPVMDYQLTDMEKEALYWLCQNKTYEDIALILGLGREGVSERLRKVYRKMHAVGKVDAIKKAIQFGLFDLH